MRDLYVEGASPIHHSDARVKIIFTLCFVIILNLTPQGAWPAYILFLALSLSIALLARVPLGLVLKRAFLVVPFVLAAFPLIFTGPPPYSHWTLSPALHIVYSPHGLVRFTTILIRAWLSVQVAILLTATTRFPDLISGLRLLKVPNSLVEIVALMWRYLFVIREEALRMLRARASRSPVSAGSVPGGGTWVWRARVTGGMAGSLFLRALERSERVYRAMLSRGYTGEPPLRAAPPLARQDRLILLASLALLAGLWGLALGLGG